MEEKKVNQILESTAIKFDGTDKTFKDINKKLDNLLEETKQISNPETSKLIEDTKSYINKAMDLTKIVNEQTNDEELKEAKKSLINLMTEAKNSITELIDSESFIDVWKLMQARISIKSASGLLIEVKKNIKGDYKPIGQDDKVKLGKASLQVKEACDLLADEDLKNTLQKAQKLINKDEMLEEIVEKALELLNNFDKPIIETEYYKLANRIENIEDLFNNIIEEPFKEITKDSVIRYFKGYKESEDIKKARKFLKKNDVLKETITDELITLLKKTIQTRDLSEDSVERINTLIGNAKSNVKELNNAKADSTELIKKAKKYITISNNLINGKNLIQARDLIKDAKNKIQNAKKRIQDVVGSGAITVSATSDATATVPPIITNQSTQKDKNEIKNQIRLARNNISDAKDFITTVSKLLTDKNNDKEIENTLNLKNLSEQPIEDIEYSLKKIYVNEKEAQLNEEEAQNVIKNCNAEFKKLNDSEWLIIKHENYQFARRLERIEELLNNIKDIYQNEDIIEKADKSKNEYTLKSIDFTLRQAK